MTIQAARGGKVDEVALREVLRGELQKRTFTFLYLYR